MAKDTHLTASGTSPTGTSEYLTVRQIAEQLSVVEETVRNWIKTGDLRALKFAGKTFRIHRDEFARFLAAAAGE